MAQASIRYIGDGEVSRFKLDGFLHIKGVFTPAEVAAIRKEALATRNHAGDVLSNPKVQHVLLNGRVLEIARQVVGGDVVYFGDSSVSFGEKSFGWHKDNADREDINAPDWSADYSLVRIGLYLQDHYNHSGGLNVRIGSHNSTNTSDGRTIYVRTHVGDLVVWNLRTTHSGNGRLLRGLPNVFLEPLRTRKLPKWLFKQEEAERVAIFITLGKKDRHLERNIKFLKTRTYMVDIWKNSFYDEASLIKAERLGLKVLDMRQAIEGETGLGLNPGYAPIPY